MLIKQYGVYIEHTLFNIDLEGGIKTGLPHQEVALVVMSIRKSCPSLCDKAAAVLHLLGIDCAAQNKEHKEGQ